MNNNIVRAVVVGLAFWAADAAALGQPDTGLRFRGVGASRQALDAMQLKPFDQSLWANLSDWSGEPLKTETIDGKVVLIVTWAGWNKTSHPAVRTAQALSDKFGTQGLIVVGVHNPRAFESAAAAAKDLGITFPYAADKDGKFRAGVRADLDPNLYLIDRAGNLRYAQIETASAEDAVSRLLGETVEQAQNVPKNLATQKAAAERDKWKTSDLKPGFAQGAVDVPYAAPEEDAYKKVKWPYIIGKVEKDDILERAHNDPPQLKTAYDESCVPSQPKRAGRITVMYFVDPRDVDELRVLPSMNAMAVEYRRDAVIICAFARHGQALKDDNSEDTKHEERNQELIKELLRSHPVNHYITPKVMRVDKLEFSEESFRPHMTNQRETSGYALLISSDDKIRWLGSPYGDDLRRSLDKLIAIDPGVQARRAAEDAKLKGAK